MAKKKVVEVEVSKEEFIRIQSKVTITVTCGLQNRDVTNPDAHVPDRLKINALWPKFSVQVNAGVGNYPAEIANWPTVKALVADKIFTIMPADEPTEEEIEKKEKFDDNKKAFEAQTGVSLESMVEG